MARVLLLPLAASERDADTYDYTFGRLDAHDDDDIDDVNEYFDDSDDLADFGDHEDFDGLDCD